MKKIKYLLLLFMFLFSISLVACVRDYKVTFYYGDEENSQYIKKGETIEPFIPSKEGFTFEYWLYDGEEFDINTKITDNILLYAYWCPNDINVTYVIDDETKNILTITSVDILKAPNDPTKEDYIFLGWYQDLENDKEAYTFNRAISNDLTLYAKWVKDDEYKPLLIVSFNSTGAKVKIDDKTIKRLDTLGTLPIVTREGYTFEGWFLDDTLITETTVIKELDDFTLVAKWKKIE